MRRKHRAYGGNVVHDFVKKHRIISRLGETVASMLPRATNALDPTNTQNQVYKMVNIARKHGYGYNQSLGMAGGGRIRM